MPKPVPVVGLDTAQRQELRERWAELVCEWCGRAHRGQCTRIRQVVRAYHPNGQLATERITLWRKWKPRADAIAPDELVEPKATR